MRLTEKSEMKLTVVVLTSLILVAGILRAGAEPGDPHLAKARTAIAGLGEGLKKELMAAMRSGGPVAAVQVCKTVAPALADASSKATGLEVGRTALKVRNPANGPDAFETRILEEFLTKIAAGADPATLEHAETVEDNGKKLFRYMKAIPTVAEPCLACHGSNLSPELKAEIDKLYPEDQATGFKAGELRGAFTVTETLE